MRVTGRPTLKGLPQELEGVKEARADRDFFPEKAQATAGSIEAEVSRGSRQAPPWTCRRYRGSRDGASALGRDVTGVPGGLRRPRQVHAEVLEPVGLADVGMSLGPPISGHIELEEPGYRRVEIGDREAEVVQPRRVHAREDVVGRRPAAVRGAREQLDLGVAGGEVGECGAVGSNRWSTVKPRLRECHAMVASRSCGVTVMPSPWPARPRYPVPTNA